MFLSKGLRTRVTAQAECSKIPDKHREPYYRGAWCGITGGYRDDCPYNDKTATSRLLRAWWLAGYWDFING